MPPPSSTPTAPERCCGEGVAAALAAPGGPSSIEWPIDLQYAEHVIDVVEPVSESPRTPDVDELAVAFALLQSRNAR